MLVIDCQVAGISGDMLLSALVDLGADKDKVLDAIFATQDFIDSSIINARFVECKRYGMRALMLDIDYKDQRDHRKGIEMLDAIDRCCNRLGMSNKARAFAIDSIKRIIYAEAKAHGEGYHEVHLHEASSIDTMVDIVGSAVALESLNAFDDKVYATKVAVGGGVLKFSHGIISNPSNAILEILKDKFTIVGGSIDDELTTPTGAAMLASIAECIDLYPSMRVNAIGYGAGKKDFEGVPNILKVVKGYSSNYIKDSIIMLETNIDDADDELLGELINRLMEKNAKDVNVIPSLTKKNRPSHIIQVLCSKEDINPLLNELFGIGTLGVRVQEVDRYILARSIIRMPIKIYDEDVIVRVKVVKHEDKVINFKVEFDDIRAIADRLNIPLRLARELVNAKVASNLKL